MTQPIKSIFAIGIFMLVLAVYVASPVVTSMDSLWSVYLAASVVKSGNLDLDEYRRVIPADDYRLDNIDGHLYSHYPVGAPLMAAPILGLFDGLLIINGFPATEYIATHPLDESTLEVEKFLASFIAAIAAAIMFLLALEFLDVYKSIALTIIFAFATSVWSTASRALWQHGPSILCLTLALYLLIKARNKPSLAALAGLPLAFSYIARPTNSLSVAILTVYVFIAYRKYFVYYLLCLAIVFLPFVAYSYSVYGQPTPIYFRPERLLVTPSVLSMLRNLFNPSRGLFIFSPILLLSMGGIYLRLKSARKPLWGNLDIYLLAIVLLHWIVISSTSMWYAGWSIGPRLFSDMIPYLVYFLIPILDYRFPKTWTSSMKTGAITILVVLTLFSVFVHYRSATSFAVLMWNGYPADIDKDTTRLYEWSDMQFFRGLCSNGDYRAPGCWFGP